MAQEINHEHKCKVCNKPAEIIAEKSWKSYEIDYEGDFVANDKIDEEPIETHFYCRDCFDNRETWN